MDVQGKHFKSQSLLKNSLKIHKKMQSHLNRHNSSIIASRNQSIIRNAQTIPSKLKQLHQKKAALQNKSSSNLKRFQWLRSYLKPFQKQRQSSLLLKSKSNTKPFQKKFLRSNTQSLIQRKSIRDQKHELSTQNEKSIKRSQTQNCQNASRQQFQQISCLQKQQNLEQISVHLIGNQSCFEMLKQISSHCKVLKSNNFNLQTCQNEQQSKKMRKKIEYFDLNKKKQIQSKLNKLRHEVNKSIKSKKFKGLPLHEKQNQSLHHKSLMLTPQPSNSAQDNFIVQSQLKNLKEHKKQKLHESKLKIQKRKKYMNEQEINIEPWKLDQNQIEFKPFLIISNSIF